MVHFIFFLNKTFLFFEIEGWNFQQLLDLGFRETLQNFRSFRQHFSMGNKSCLNELKFCEVPQNKSKRCWKFQFSILTNKKVLFLKKIWSVPCTMDSFFFSQQMLFCLATLIVHMALIYTTTCKAGCFSNGNSDEKSWRIPKLPASPAKFWHWKNSNLNWFP